MPATGAGARAGEGDTAGGVEAISGGRGGRVAVSSEALAAAAPPIRPVVGALAEVRRGGGAGRDGSCAGMRGVGRMRRRHRERPAMTMFRVLLAAAAIIAGPVVGRAPGQGKPAAPERRTPEPRLD